MTTVRIAIAPPGSAGYFHCVSRCVRRAWLCGFDQHTGRSFEQRIRETAAQLENVDRLLEPVAGVPGQLSLGLSIRHYLGLVDCTGRIMHPGKRGKIETGAPSVLETLGIATTQKPSLLRQTALSQCAWTAQIWGTENGFYRVIGAAEGILAYAEAIGQRWLQGVGVARSLAERRKPPRPA